MSQCSHEGCPRPVNARGLCNTHYMQQRRAGLLPIGTRARGTLEDRFWRFVEKTDGCWNWTGRSLNKKGYGQIGMGGKGAKHITAHRLSYIIHNGNIPEGMIILHSCDNPNCVNPSHLRSGTQSENILEAIAKGRKTPPKLPYHSGETHPSAKITELQAREIKFSGRPLKDLSKEFGLSYTTVRRIRAGIIWKGLV